MGPVEALKLALGKEKEAMELYKKFELEFPAAREIFSFLVEEENRHKIMIEKKIVELTK